MTYDIPAHMVGDTWKGIYKITLVRNSFPVNLTDCAIKIQFRSIYNLASPVVLELTTENNDITILDPDEGIIRVEERVVDIPIGIYNYDLAVITPTGRKTTYLIGTWEVNPRIATVDQRITVAIDQDVTPPIVYIDDMSIPALSQFITDFRTLSAKWQETAVEMDTVMQPLSAKWQETAVEMDTLQIAPTGHWQDVYEYIDRGVVDAGYF